MARSRVKDVVDALIEVGKKPENAQYRQQLLEAVGMIKDHVQLIARLKQHLKMGMAEAVKLGIADAQGYLMGASDERHGVDGAKECLRENVSS